MRKKLYKLQLVLSFIWFVVNTSIAQNFPIEVVTQLTKPYSLRLTDYGAGNGERVNLTLLLKDINRTNYQVRLRLVIEGAGISIFSKPSYIGKIVLLQGGIPEQFNGLELADYFNPNNLEFQGFTRAQYDRAQKLPEGIYSIRFEVLDFIRNVPVAAPKAGETMAWLAENDPPIINQPYQNEKVQILEPQNVIFSWTPRHLSSPNAAIDVEYEVTIVQLIPKTRNPNDAILTSNPILRTTTQSTTFIYGLSEPTLLAGESYALQVRVIEKNGLEIFKNRGRSEVVKFIYGEVCLPATNATAQVLAPTRAKITYEAGAGNTRYKVRFREKTVENNATWFEENSSLAYVNLLDLKPSTTYEYEVLSFCGDLTPTNQITTRDTFQTRGFSAQDFACGRVPKEFTLQNQVPKASLVRGDTIVATDFKIAVGRIEGGQGVFSGEGIVVMPFMNNIKVKAAFKNIKVNEENRMIDGIIAITGASAQVLDDSTLATVQAQIAEIEGFLNQAEAALDQIDIVLDKIDLVTAKMYEYLPERIQIRLDNARDSLAAAKKELKGLPANATEEQRAAAKEKLRKAKLEMKQSLSEAIQYYVEALGKFVNIIWESVKKLKNDIVESNTNNPEQSFKSADEAVYNAMFQGQGLETPSSLSPPIEEENFHVEEVEEDPNMPFATLVQNHYERKQKLKLKLIATIFVKYYLSLDKVKNNFRADTRIKGVEIIDFVFKKLRLELPESEIINLTTDKIIEQLIWIADNSFKED
jgi:hypothetical protein